MPQPKLKPRLDEFHGRPVLTSAQSGIGKEYEFFLTLRLARAVLEYHEEIQDFVKAHE